MLNRIVCAFVVILVPTAGGVGQNDTSASKVPTKIAEVEARLHDGSAIRAIVLQESLEIVTKYGKLTVPTNDIHWIDFGLRVPKELQKKIEANIRRLGDKSHEQREAASKELVGIGARAFPALQRAADSPDPEVARRAREAMKQLRQKIPAQELRIQEQDHILTSELPISGRILSPTVKVRTAQSGEKELKLMDLRSLRWLGPDDEKKTDEQKLQGAWELVSAEADGKALAPETFDYEGLFFKDGKMTIEQRGGSNPGKFKLAATKTPRTIDFGSPWFVTRRGHGLLDSWLTIEGVYLIKGDTLTICYVKRCDASILPKKRPTDFTTSGDPDRFLVVFKRAKP